jgi:hypothetical protein
MNCGLDLDIWDGCLHAVRSSQFLDKKSLKNSVKVQYAVSTVQVPETVLLLSCLYEQYSLHLRNLTLIIVLLCSDEKGSTEGLSALILPHNHTHRRESFLYRYVYILQGLIIFKH